MQEREYYVAFSNCAGIGPAKLSLLLDQFGSAKIAYNAKKEALVPVIGPLTTEKFILSRKLFSLEKYVEKLEKTKVAFITSIDKEYPKKLKEIPRAPYILYYRGRAPREVQPLKTIAVVGTRKITQYGRDVTTMLTQELVRYGFTIVSGLAMGVDAAAHLTTIQNNGYTVAVLGCGVDCCNPTQNQQLYNSIIEKGGTIISESPLSEPPTPGSFPARNRIVAGLSDAVLVTEGAAGSGALITADYAFQFGRKVFAVPGQITSSLSKGPHQLLEKGAKMVTSAQDILNELQISNVKVQINTNEKSLKFQKLTKEEQRVIDALENEPKQFDQIVRELQSDPAVVGSLLSLMEIKGIVKNQGNGIFAIIA